MQQAVIYSRAKLKGGEGVKHNAEEEEEKSVNLASERAKYQNFWIGVNRGINIDSKNPRIIEDGAKRTASTEKARSRYLFKPHGRLKIVWDGVMLVLILFSVVMVPIGIAFEPKVTMGAAMAEDFILLFFALDICANFNTAFVDPKTEVLVLNRRDIAIEYMKFWFWLDMLSTVPFGYLADYIASGGSNIGALRVVRSLRLFRVFKLLRVMKMNDTLMSLRINPQMVNLAVLILAIFMTAHIFACIWHFLALYKQNNNGGETWVTVLGFENTNIYDRYVASLYFIMVTMMTIGYGDIHPVTDNERIFAIVTMLTGGVVFGAMISRLASILESRNPEAKALSRNMAELKSYLVGVSLPVELRKRAIAAYSYYLSKKSAFGEPSFFEQLPQPILYRLVKQMNEEDIRCVRLFHTYEMDFVVPLLLAIKPFQASAGDVIFEEGDICSAIVFLKKGKIAISSSNGFSNVLAGYVRAGGYFGDMEYLRRTTCVATYSASKHSDLLSVSHNDINHASSKCLEAGVRFRKENQVRYDLFNQVLHENKRDGEADRTQYTLEESRVIVDQLLRGKGRSPRRRSSIGLEKPGVSPRRSLVNTTKKAQSLWVDGAIVGTRNLNLLARNAEKTIPLELDVNMLRVIYVNAHGNISAGEVPSGYLPKHLVINPLNRYKVAWDLLTAFLVFYSILIIPVEIAFNQQLFAGSLTVDKVTDGFFLFDVVLNFRTAYFEDGGDHLVIVPSLIAQKYMSTWLVSDLLGSLPFDAIADAMFSSHTNLTFTKLLKVVRLVRLLKIMRLLKLGHLSELLEEQLGLSPTAMDLLVMLMQVFFVGHLVACVLYGVSGSITDHPWWSLDIPSVHATQVGATLSSKYILSLYWTFTIMSTVGYGDISPETTSERILNVFVILLGASMFGYMIANVSSLIQSFNSADAVKTEKISSITEYLDEKQCPYKIQDAVIKHFQNYYKHASPFDVDTILSRLPHRLASEIALLHNDTTIKHIAVLKYVENTTVRLFIFNLMKPVYFEPNEVLVKQGSPGNEILFVVEGKGVAFKRKEVAKRPRAKAPARAPTPTGPGLVSAFFNTSNAMMDSFFGTPQKPDDKSAAGSPAPRAPSPDAVTESGSSKKTTLPSIPEAAAVPPSAKLSTAADDKRARAVVEPDEILHVEDAFIDLEPMAQSPPPPLPHRANRFGLMHIETKHSWAEDSESDEEFEYASLRLHHSPLAATNASARVVKPATAGEDLFSTAGRQIFTYSDKKQQSMKEAAVETFEESDSEDGSAELDEDGHPLRFDPSFTWTEANMAKKGLEMVGDISPGDFVGHLSLMHESINLVSVVTATFSTVYTLNKQEITPLLSKQPTVAIHLQMALSRAISAQSDMLGKLHMRQVRSKFINRNKEEFYHKMGVLPREVKQIRRAQKNKMKKIAISIKSSVKAAEPAQKLRKQSFYLGSGINNMSMSGNLHVESLDATEIDHGPKHPHSGVMGMGGFQLRRLQSTSHIAAEALAAQVRVLPRKTVRKVKCVERVLNKYSMLYESDEENNEEDGFAFDGDASFSGKGSSSKKHRVHAHRTALPVAVANRSVAPPKPLLERRRRQSYILGADPASRRSLLLRLLSSNSKEIAKKAPRVNRVMSLNDLETLEPPPDPNEHHLLAMGSDTLVDPSAPPSDLHSRVVPLWSNQKAVRHEADLRGRRQSFPSLDNDLWKISSVCQGLL